MKTIPMLYSGLVATTLLASFLGAPLAQSQTPMSLSDYLGQVEGRNDGLRASRALSHGAELRSEEGRLLLSPQFYGRFNYSSDSRETVSPDFQGRQTENQSYVFGFKQSTSFGLDASLTYNINSTTISGANPIFVSQPSFYTAAPVLELSQSLWRNGFGSQTQARQELIEAQALATSHAESYQAQVLRADAESAYWTLALARELVRVQRESLARFEKIRDLHRQKSGMGLSDRADLLQAVAGVESRKLELRNAQDSERVAARTFNTIRGLDNDQVNELLAPLDLAAIEEMRPPQRAEMREDVKAAQQQERIAIANAKISRDQASPDLRVFASLSLNGRDPSLGDTVPESFTGQHPLTSVGVEFTAPLDIGKLVRTREGYAETQKGAEYRYQRALYDQERQWNDLHQRFDEAKSRFAMARAVERSQKEKLEYEKSRHSHGRTTTFQVLTFEQDYANSQLASIQAQATILQSIAQMKTFGGAL